MPRCGNLRRYIWEIAETPRAELMSFVPPFLILIIEIVLLNHALHLKESYVIVLTSTLLTVSVVELILVARELHQHSIKNTFDRTLTIKLDDFITETNKINVKDIVSKFIERYPMYLKNRGEVYRLTCQIMQTHKDEIVEKEYTTKVAYFVKRTKLTNASEILAEFVSKYPKYEKYSSDLYERICNILDKKD
jgi:hypothetical protein